MSSWSRLATQLADLPAGAAVLEVGTGGGALFGYLLDLLDRPGASWRLVTADCSAAACAAARARLASHPRVAAKVQVIHADVVEMACGGLPGGFDIVVASALLSAVPMASRWSQDRVIAALAGQVAVGGWLLVEDYLPLAPPGSLTVSAQATAQDLWRLHKALAELAGGRHYEELSPKYVADRLCEAGLQIVECGVDERLLPRPLDLGELFEHGGGRRPEGLDPVLWAALDRYRRDLVRRLGTEGAVQWSGWFRLVARKL